MLLKFSYQGSLLLTLGITREQSKKKECNAKSFCIKNGQKQLSKFCSPKKLRLFFFNVAKHTSYLLLGWARKLVKLRGHKISCKLLESETTEQIMFSN